MGIGQRGCEGSGRAAAAAGSAASLTPGRSWSRQPPGAACRRCSRCWPPCCPPAGAPDTRRRDSSDLWSLLIGIRTRLLLKPPGGPTDTHTNKGTKKTGVTKGNYKTFSKGGIGGPIYHGGGGSYPSSKKPDAKPLQKHPGRAGKPGSGPLIGALGEWI